GRPPRRSALLARGGCPDLPGRQPAHQAVPVLGVADRRSAAPTSRRDLPLRGVHAAEGHASPDEARLQPVVHLLRLAEHEAGARRVLHRARARTGTRLLPPERLAEHAGHPHRVPAVRRPPPLPPPPPPPP